MGRHGEAAARRPLRLVRHPVAMFESPPPEAEADLSEVRASPSDSGTVELIARRRGGTVRTGDRIEKLSSGGDR